MNKIRHTPRQQAFWQSNKPYWDKQPISNNQFRFLGYSMSFLAGAINAGGFFAVASYTSHVSGALSGAADYFVLGQWRVALTALLSVVCFVLGAAHGNWTILWAKRQRFRSSYGMAMWLEAVYLLIFGLFAVVLERVGAVMVQPTVILLCFIMGIHNSVMTVISGGSIRSTHMTGTATDLGIELSKALYYQKDSNPRLPDVRVNGLKARLLAVLMVSFVLGGMVGAWGYQKIGHHFTLPVAIILFLLGFNSIGYDMKIRLKWYLRKRRLQTKNKTQIKPIQ